MIPDEKEKAGMTFWLAPTYDHASSLGRNESDIKRKLRLDGKNPQYTVAKYAEKCRSALFENVGDAKPMTTIEAAIRVAKMEPEASKVWIDAISKISQSTLELLFARIPSDRISPIGVEFAIKVLQINKSRLLSLRETLS